jgi:NTE family protein
MAEKESNGVEARKGGKVMGWLQTAIDRVRDFAYAERPPEHAASRRPIVGLALGGGFARGIAHLGVIRALQQNNVPIDCIAGTSAGALAGIAYSSGLPFDEVVRKASAIRFGNFGQWRISKMGLASNTRLEAYPEKFLGVRTFDELKIPLAIAATDLISGEAVYFRHGPLGPPLRASCAYPGLFLPVEYEGRMLVDGFVSAAVPVEGARLMGAEVVIAVFLEAETMERPKNVVDVIGRSFSIFRLQVDAIGWRTKADIVITPRVREFAWDDFARTSELVAAGEEAAVDALPRIRAALQPVAERARPS